MQRTQSSILLGIALLIAAVVLFSRGLDHPTAVDAAGANSIASPDTFQNVGQYTSLSLDAAGLPVVSYYDATDRDLNVLHCTNATCSVGNAPTTPDTGGDVGTWTSLALDASGFPVISYRKAEFQNGDLKVLRCGDATCTSGNSIVSADVVGDVGEYTSLALDASGFPVVSYYDTTNGDLKLLRCGNATCSAGNTITSPDTEGNVGTWTSLALDASGFPVIAYIGNGDLKLLHCDDATCSTGDVVVTLETSPGFGSGYISLLLDASGFPVISYYRGGAADLNVLRCGDANCSSGNVITSPDTVGGVGPYTSLALDASGFPVVSYNDGSNGDLKVLHCGNATCSSGNTTTAPDTAGNVGLYTSLALDASGFPAVSYYDATNDDLKVMRCNDPDCDAAVNGAESVTSPDNFPNVGQYTSLALDSSGFPVVSYYDLTNSNLLMLRCGNAACSAGNTITPADTDANVGTWASLALDASGFPVISYRQADFQQGDLRILHCGDATCGGVKPPPPTATNTATPAPTSTPIPTSTATPTPTKQPPPGDTDEDGCSDAQENGPDEAAGGQRDYLNFWDFFDTPNASNVRDRVIDIGDIFRVVDRFGTFGDENIGPLSAPPASGYHTAYDRSAPTGDPWDLGPADGTVDAGDILFAVAQFGHSCA